MVSTRQSYNDELEALRQNISSMGQAVDLAMYQAMKALIEQDLNLAQAVIDGDDVIDAMEIAIEDKCMVLIARQQPLAKDLRIIGTGFKISTDLERIGDHATNIAEIALELAQEQLVKPLVDMPQMATIAQEMLEDALKSYINLDISLAEAVCIKDDKVDDLYKKIFCELSKIMAQDSEKIKQSTQLMFVARYIERIADHATNIAEWVIYLVTAQRMRKN